MVDAYDAMVSRRPHRPALAVDDALDTLEAGIGTRFDPFCVAHFTGVMRERIANRIEVSGAHTLFAEVSIREYEARADELIAQYPQYPPGELGELLISSYPELDEEAAGRIVLARIQPDLLGDDFHSDDAMWLKDDEVAVRHPAQIDADVGSIVCYRNRLYMVLYNIAMDDGRREYLLKR